MLAPFGLDFELAKNPGALAWTGVWARFKHPSTGIAAFKQKVEHVLLHDVLEVSGGHQRWTSERENHDDVYEPIHLADRCVSSKRSFATCLSFYNLKRGIGFKS